MKYTIKEFAKEIRKLYPNDYNDLTDEKLVELWLKKYPNDREKIDFSKDVKVKGQTTEPSNTTSGSSWGFLKTIFLLGLIAGGIYLFYNSTKNKNYTSNDSISGTEQSSSSNNVSESSNTTPINELENIEIDPSISDEVDNTPFIQNLGLSEDSKIKIKKILSDPNPDPENKNQTAASTENFNCKWCSKEFSHASSNYISIQALLRRKLFDGSVIYVTWMTAIVDESGKVDSEKGRLNYIQLIEEICNFYDVGTKYTTYNVDPSEFCSEKCKTEYKYNH